MCGRGGKGRAWWTNEVDTVEEKRGFPLQETGTGRCAIKDERSSDREIGN